MAGLTLKASILKSMGRVNEALAATHNALIQVYSLYPDAPEPPGFLLDLNADLREVLDTLPRLSITRSGQQCTVSWIGAAYPVGCQNRNVGSAEHCSA